MEWCFAFPKRFLALVAALLYTILVLNNITDYGSNYEFVRYVLMMDSTFWEPPHVARRQFAAGHTVSYAVGIIAWESVTMLHAGGLLLG